MKTQNQTPANFLGRLNDVEAKHAPEHLYTLGDTSLLNGYSRVAIVGSRKASEDGLRRARSLAKTLVENKVVVVSGLAEGIDTAAHESAIQQGGRTIAVMGTPLDKPYPASNRLLYQRIVRDHLAVSQFPSGYPGGRKNFPMRNRTMALLTDATVIVEAGEKSGTLHQGWEALRLGRLLLLMESVANNPDLSWPKEMIGYGAQVLTRNNLGAVLENLPMRADTADIAL